MIDGEQSNTRSLGWHTPPEHPSWITQALRAMEERERQKPRARTIVRRTTAPNDPYPNYVFDLAKLVQDEQIRRWWGNWA